MLVTFTTEAYADITMFGSAARPLLKMMGQSGNVPGALMADDIPAALEALSAGLAEAADEPPVDGATEASDDDDDVRPVPIATRALPLVKLLEAARNAKANVLWSGDE